MHVGLNPFSSVFPIPQIICISDFRPVSSIVNTLWLFEKYTMVNMSTLVTSLELSF